MKGKGKDSSGNGLVTGVALGCMAGVVLGVVFDNLSLWIAIGVALGTSIGVAQRGKNRISPDKSGHMLISGNIRTKRGGFLQWVLQLAIFT